MELDVRSIRETLNRRLCCKNPLLCFMVQEIMMNLPTFKVAN